jgi:hypothetical protein
MLTTRQLRLDAAKCVRREVPAEFTAEATRPGRVLVTPNAGAIGTFADLRECLRQADIAPLIGLERPHPLGRLSAPVDSTVTVRFDPSIIRQS